MSDNVKLCQIMSNSILKDVKQCQVLFNSIHKSLGEVDIKSLSPLFSSVFDMKQIWNTLTRLRSKFIVLISL